MKILGPRLLVEPLPQATHSAGGIAYAPNYRDDKKQHKVLAVGSGKRQKDGSLVPLEIIPGDHVLVELYTGQLHTFDDGKMIINASDVVAFWRNEHTQPD